MSDFLDRIRLELSALDQEGNLRSLKNIANKRGKILIKDGRELLNFSSNDYLGLCDDTSLIEKFYSFLPAAIQNYSPGSGASRLLSGNFSLYGELEKEIHALYGQDGNRALVFNSGYHANTGIIQALCGKDDLIVSDKINHASIIDGVRLSGATLMRYNHNDLGHLERILCASERYRNVFIITESIFSMDGDISHLEELLSLKGKYNAVLYVDEAHSFGVRGDNGAGLAYEKNVMAGTDILIATFGKAAGGVGAFCYTSREIADYLVNKCRSMIFSTALPPVCINWNLFALSEIAASSERRNHLAAISDLLRNKLNGSGIETAGESHIIPVMIGESSKAVEFACALESEGLAAFAVRPPTVPAGSARIRFSLSAAFTESEIEFAAGKIIKTAERIL